jgi:hypothetical protein
MYAQIPKHASEYCSLLDGRGWGGWAQYPKRCSVPISSPCTHSVFFCLFVERASHSGNWRSFFGLWLCKLEHNCRLQHIWRITGVCRICCVLAGFWSISGVCSVAGVCSMFGVCNMSGVGSLSTVCRLSGVYSTSAVCNFH